MFLNKITPLITVEDKSDEKNCFLVFVNKNLNL